MKTKLLKKFRKRFEILKWSNNYVKLIDHEIKHVSGLLTY